MNDEAPSDSDAAIKQEGQNPYQFGIIHIIIATVWVAVWCALGRELGFTDVAQFVGLNLLALFGFAFVKCCYALPALFEGYRGRNIVHCGLGLLVVVSAISLSGNIFLETELGLGLYAILFPFVTIYYLISHSILADALGFQILIFYFLTYGPVMIAQWFIYSIVTSLTWKKSGFALAIAGILIFHGLASWVSFLLFELV